jgi:plasmid stabilization system protein ParE
MRVQYSPRARDDLIAILIYIEHRSPQGARNVARALRKTIELIGEFPQSGRLAGEQGTRVLPVGRYPYSIYWINEGDEVWIVHVRHTARRPWNPDQDRF